MKRKLLVVLMSSVMTMALFTGCSTNTETASNTTTETEKAVEEASETTTKESATAETPKKSESSSSSYTKKSTSTTNFTNAYGTPTTKCAHAGCNNYIASSGDTNCCTVHSNKCLECGKYIDEDAMYCISCLEKAADEIKEEKSNSSYGSYDKDDSSAGYGYDPNDPYYSANDHDGDGKISDEEFQDAMGDFLDDLMESGGY